MESVLLLLFLHASMRSVACAGQLVNVDSRYCLTRISLGLQGNLEVAFESQRAARNTGPILKLLAFHARHGNWRFISESLLRARWEHVKMLFRWMVDLAGAPRK